MDISKFDFTKFSQEKWQQIVKELQGNYQYVDEIKVYYYDEVRKDIFPVVELTCVSDTEVDGWETYYLCFSAFKVKFNGRVLETATENWRKIMIKEFKEDYYLELKNQLQIEREQKIQKADEEYYKELDELSKSL